MKKIVFIFSKTAIFILIAFLALKALGFIESLTIGLLIAVGTAWVQHRSWKNQERVKVLDYEKRKAYELIDEISSIVGKRIYHQKALALSIKNSTDAINQDLYTLSVREMNEKYYNICLGLRYYFGGYAVEKYNKDFQTRLALNSQQISRILTQASAGEAIKSVERELRTTDWDLHKFSSGLLSKIRENEFSQFTNTLPTVRFSNRKKLPLTYLFLRLFNLRD